MPDLTYTLIVSEKKLSGADGTFAAILPGDNNSVIAQFAGMIPRDRVRDIDLLDQIKVEVTFIRATPPVAEPPASTPALASASAAAPAAAESLAKVD